MPITPLNHNPHVEKTVRVEIIADTIISRNGRGVTVLTGSVLDVTALDAQLLFAGNKAIKTDKPVEVVLPPENKPALSKKGA